MNKTEKTENEKSSYPQSSIREDLSSAESRSRSRDDEVHSGVDLVKEIGFSSSQIRITHVTCIEWKMFDIFYKSGTAELTSSLDIAGDEVF